MHPGAEAGQQKLNRAEINTTWLRWLDGRSVKDEVAQSMIAILDEDRELLDHFLDDLEVHRQLQAAGNLDSGDYAFVGRMMAHYESSIEGLFDSPTPNVDTHATPEIEVQSPGNRFRTTREVAPPVIKVELQDSEIESPVRKEARKHSSRQRILALALCVPLVAACLFAAFEMGKQSVHSPDSKPPSESPSDRIAENQKTESKEANQGEINPFEPENRIEDEPDAVVLNPEKDPANPFEADVQNGNDEEGLMPNPGAERIADRRPDNPPIEPIVTFASVSEKPDAEWAIRPPTWPRLGTQSLELISGEAEIEWDEGGAIQLKGPAVVTIGKKFVDVINGQVEVDLPDHGNDTIAIQAKDSRIEPDGIARFNLNVPEQGLSDLSIDRGAIRVTPWKGRFVGVEAENMLLSPEGFNQLEIGDRSDDQPAVARLSGPNDAFEGWVNFNDRIIRSPKRELVDDVFQLARKRFEESPEDLVREWKTLSDMVSDRPQRFAPPAQQFPPPEFEEMKERIEKMMEEMGQPGFRFPDANMRGGGFQFSFDGNDMQFQSDNLSPEQEKQLLGSFAEFVDELRNKGPERE